MTRRAKYKDIITKEFLLQCIQDRMTLIEVADMCNTEYGWNMNASAVHYWAKKFGLRWGRLRREPVELDVEGLLEATQMVQRTIRYIKDIKMNPIDYEYVLKDPIMLLIGDTHAGSFRDRKGEIDWVEQAQSRFKYLKEGLINRLLWSKHYPSKITICLLGDMIEGFSVYPSQIENSHAIINDQIEIITGEILQLILDLYQYTEEIEVVGVQGNHGRISKQSEINNWDSLVYLTIQKAVNYVKQTIDEGEVPWNISVKYAPKFLLYHKEGPWTYLLGHGHKILSRGALNNISKMNTSLLAKASYSEDFDVFLMGHVHQTRYWTMGHRKYFISNGACYDSEHFANELGLPTDLRFVAFSYNEHTPIANLWFIPLVPEDYYD